MGMIANKVNVSYKLPEGIDEKMDQTIINALESVGLKWYAQGYSFESGERDIAFDFISRD